MGRMLNGLGSMGYRVAMCTERLLLVIDIIVFLFVTLSVMVPMDTFVFDRLFLSAISL